MRNAPNSIGNVRKSVQPIAVNRSMRRQSARGITTLPAGKMVPLAAFPLLREDAVRSGRLRLSFEHMETAEALMNAIRVSVKAYLVPFLALERFNGSLDQLNLSYEGKPPMEGDAVVPFIETRAWNTLGTNAVHKYLGLHSRPTQQVNTAYLEAYNCIWNFRAENRSKELPLRTRLDTTLAPAFWVHEQFRHFVADFDEAKMDGEVALNITNTQLNVRGSGVPLAFQTNGTGSFSNLRTTAGGTTITNSASAAASGPLHLAASSSGIFAELLEDGITVSLANIDLARKTQAFAQLRQQYNAHDDWIINLLMDGISIPDQAFKQPMLIAERNTVFGQSKRYATDSGNLTESVVNGGTSLDLSLQIPRIGTGGIVMVVAEITPDQLFERQEDPFLHTTNVEQLPQYLRDELDPEKVDIVTNGRIDTSHATPNATFAYEPLNARWNIEAPRVGGEFYRPAVDAGFDERRQRIWAVETQNPTLAQDFYLCTTMHTKPFVVTNQDPFECVTQGDVFIEGNTVFGGHLIEASDDYEKVMAIAPQDRIAKP